MRAHGVKQKPPVCARVRVPIMNMYGSFCGRYVRVLFAPRDSCVRARSKDAAHLPFSLHPPLSHTCIFPPSFRSISLSLSLIRSFFLLAHLYSCIRRLRDRVLRLVLLYRLFLRRLCVTFISGCDRAAVLITCFSKRYARDTILRCRTPRNSAGVAHVRNKQIRRRTFC